MLAVTGLLSAVVTLTLASLIASLATRSQLGELLPGLFPGMILGLFIAAYFYLFENDRSISKTLIVTASSIAAYYASILVAFAMLHAFPLKGSLNSHLEVPPPIFFFSGFVGAFLVLGVAVFLYGPKISSWPFRKWILLASFGGGLLGVIGWLSAPVVGQPFLFLLSAIHLAQNHRGNTVSDEDHFTSLYLVWQTGLTFMLGMLLRHARSREKEQE
jgi:hypothetical protein